MRVLAILIIPFLCSCSLFEEETDEVAIARVEDKYLFQEDIVGIVPPETAKEDSAFIIDNYIEGWVKDNLILQKAELNLKENQKDVNEIDQQYIRGMQFHYVDNMQDVTEIVLLKGSEAKTT